MIIISGNKSELDALNNMLKLKSLCPFGVRENIKRCIEMKNCAMCIDTNIKWEEKENGDNQND